jgi:hypothetical protein
MVFLNASDQSNLKPAADAALSAAPPPQRAVARARPKRPRKVQPRRDPMSFSSFP